MTKRERAIQIADDAIERIETGSIMPDTQDLMAYALVLVLADISERLDDIAGTIQSMPG